MTDGYMFAFGPCWACKQLFGFDPDAVPSIPIDPVTGRPPDLGGDPERAVRQPICPACIDEANRQRALVDLPPIRPTDRYT